MNRFAVLSLAVAGANARLFSRQSESLIESGGQAFEQTEQEAFESNIYSICMPRDNATDSRYDWNAPCNAVMAIEYQCMYGPEAFRLFSADPSDLTDDDLDGVAYDEETNDPVLLPYETQRDCVCQSQFKDMASGCQACFVEHGSSDPDFTNLDDKLDSVFEDYCNVDQTPTDDFANVLYESFDTATSAEASSAAPTSFSDPIGNATDVSLYFTPSVTGTGAYIPAIPTPESSGGNASYTSLRTSGGQIVPTAGAGGSESEDGGSEESGSASATESDSGAVQTAMAQAGVMGAVGIAALMAAL